MYNLVYKQLLACSRMDGKSQELRFSDLIVVQIKYHLGRHFVNAFCSFRAVVRS